MAAWKVGRKGSDKVFVFVANPSEANAIVCANIVRNPDINSSLHRVTSIIMSRNCRS